MNDVVLVKREKVKGELSLYVLMFGSAQQYPIRYFVGNWKYIGKEREVEESSTGN